MTQNPPQRARARFAASVLAASLAILAIAASVLAVTGVLNYARAAAKPLAQRPPTATVTRGSVVKAIQGTVSLQATRSWVVTAPSSAGAGAVFTRDGVAGRATIAAGTVLAVVNERPVIVSTGDMPFYRALHAGSEGRDVAQLQAFLRASGHPTGADRSGVYGAGTAIGAYRLYQHLGFAPLDAAGNPVDAAAPNTTAVPLGELVALGSGEVTADSACGSVGHPIGELPICTVSSTQTQARVTVPADDGAAVHPGMTAEVDAGGRALLAKVGNQLSTAPSPRAQAETSGQSDEKSESDPAEAQSTSATAAFALTPIDASTVSQMSGRSATITIATSKADSLKAPEIAVRSDAAGRQTWLERPSGERATVTVGVCADGYCEVSGHISEGDRIVLPAVSASDSDD